MDVCGKSIPDMSPVWNLRIITIYSAVTCMEALACTTPYCKQFYTLFLPLACTTLSHKQILYPFLLLACAALSHKQSFLPPDTLHCLAYLFATSMHRTVTYIYLTVEVLVLLCTCEDSSFWVQFTNCIVCHVCWLCMYTCGETWSIDWCHNITKSCRLHISDAVIIPVP